MNSSPAIPVPNTPRRAPDPAMDDVLRAIRLRFIDCVHGRLMKFEDLKQVFHTDPAKLTPLSEIGALSHKIAGVAETLGFGDIGQLAGWIDGEITRRARAGEPPIAIWRKIDSPLEDMLEKMEDLLDA